MILKGAEPFFLPGNKENGILLTHGFTGSPSEMLLLGEYLNKLGYTVLGVRLCGHGTTPEDMSHTVWQDWYQSVCDGYLLLKGCCSQITAVGLSMGSILSLLLSLDYHVDKLIALSTPLFIAAQRGLNSLPPRKQCHDDFIPKPSRKYPGVDEHYTVHYKKTPVICVYELLECINYLKINLKNITAPLLIIQSNNDHTASPKSAQYLYDNVQSPSKKILHLNHSGHLITLDSEKEIVFSAIADFIQNK